MDCFPRCIEYCLGLDPGSTDIPRPSAADIVPGDTPNRMKCTTEYNGRLAAWLHGRGVFVVDLGENAYRDGQVSLLWNLEKDLRPLVIAGGPRVGDGLGHAVVCRGLPLLHDWEIVFNPSPSEIEEWRFLTLLVKAAGP